MRRLGVYARLEQTLGHTVITSWPVWCMCVCVHACVYMHVCVHACMCVCVHVCVYMHVFVCVCVYVCVKCSVWWSTRCFDL